MTVESTRVFDGNNIGSNKLVLLHPPTVDRCPRGDDKIDFYLLRKHRQDVAVSRRFPKYEKDTLRLNSVPEDDRPSSDYVQR